MKENKEFYDNLYSKNWGSNYSMQPSRNMRYHFVLREVEKILKNKKDKKISILDYGCGNGYLVDLLVKKYHLSEKNITSFDISKKAISLASKFSKGEFTNSLDNKKFDLILFIDVIEHISDDKNILNYLYKLMNNKGTLIISTSLYNLYWTKSDDIGGHVRRYTIKELKEKLSQSGFKIKNIYSYGFPFGVMYYLLKGSIIKKGSKSEVEIISSKKDKFYFVFLIKLLTFLFKINIPFFGNQVIVVATKD